MSLGTARHYLLGAGPCGGFVGGVRMIWVGFIAPCGGRVEYLVSNREIPADDPFWRQVGSARAFVQMPFPASREAEDILAEMAAHDDAQWRCAEPPVLP